MANAYKVLGQANLTAETPTDVYTVPSATEAVISTIVVANLSTANTFRLSIRPNGESQADKHYIAYDVSIGANDSTTLTLGVTLDAADVITAYSGSSADISVNIFGTEITA